MWWKKVMWLLMNEIFNKINMLKSLRGGLFLLAIYLLSACASNKFNPVVAEQKTINDVSVKVIYKADGLYQVQVLNNLPDTINLLWNISAYVNTTGDTTRLIHISDSDQFPETTPLEQVPWAIVRGAKLSTYFVGESWLDYARRGVSPKPKSSKGVAKLFLAFEIKGKRTYWTGEVAFVKAAK
jgi:hypothetical protein